ncbi:MAG TPA: thioredoxin [Polyangiaceae bacterium]|nr:thioredoxin [Polyangiaceae bacterium]
MERPLERSPTRFVRSRPAGRTHQERCAMAGKNVHTFDTNNFESEVLKSDVPVLVDFTATWCGPCKQLAPIVDKLADELEGKVKVGKLDIDESRAIATKYNVRSVPTVMIFQGGVKKDQHVGLTNREKLVKLLGL